MSLTRREPLVPALVQRTTVYGQPAVKDYTEGNRVFQVVLSRPVTTGSYDRTTHAYVNDPDLELYRGPARITTTGAAGDYDIGDERTAMQAATISINGYPTSEAKPAPRVDDLVEILSTPQGVNTHLAGRTFAVTDVSGGGMFAVGYVLAVLGAAPSRRT